VEPKNNTVRNNRWSQLVRDKSEKIYTFLHNLTQPLKNECLIHKSEQQAGDTWIAKRTRRYSLSVELQNHYMAKIKYI